MPDDDDDGKGRRKLLQFSSTRSSGSGGDGNARMIMATMLEDEHGQRGSSQFPSLDMDHHGYDATYVVIFGVVANIMIILACMTTMAFVQRRRRMNKMAMEEPEQHALGPRRNKNDPCEHSNGDECSSSSRFGTCNHVFMQGLPGLGSSCFCCILPGQMDDDDGDDDGSDDEDEEGEEEKEFRGMESLTTNFHRGYSNKKSAKNTPPCTEEEEEDEGQDAENDSFGYEQQWLTRPSRFISSAQRRTLSSSSPSSSLISGNSSSGGRLSVGSSSSRIQDASYRLFSGCHLAILPPPPQLTSSSSCASSNTHPDSGNGMNMIPEVYASRNADVQAMMLSTATVNQFFHSSSSSQPNAMSKMQGTGTPPSNLHQLQLLQLASTPAAIHRTHHRQQQPSAIKWSMQ